MPSNGGIVASSTNTHPNKTTKMKTQKKSRKISRRIGASLRAGFSLVELLIVIAVIGIIAAIAIPSISSVTGSAQYSKAQRNAQTLASTYSAAVAAGSTNFSGITAASNAVTALVDTTTPVTGSGNFSSNNFTVPNLSTNEQMNALEFLTWTNGQLIYNPDQTAIGSFTNN